MCFLEISTFISNLVIIFTGFIVFFVFFYTWCLNRAKNWWIWNISFWPPKTTESAIRHQAYGFNTPISALSMRIALVNTSIFPIVFHNATLKIDYCDKSYELAPYGFKDDSGSKSVNSGLRIKEEFRPILVKPRSEEVFELIFISNPLYPEQSFHDLRPGAYRFCLLLKKTRGKPEIIKFKLDLVEGFTQGFLDIDYPLMVLHRDIQFIPSKSC